MVLKNIYSSKKILIIVPAIALLLGIGFYYHTSRPDKGSGVIPSSDTAQSIKKSAASTDTVASTQPTPSSAKNPVGTTDSNAQLLAPTGTFVSNHRPSLSGSDQQLAEQSVCNTNAQASCFIKFTKGSIVKTLAVQTTDNTGATYWSWKVNEAGLTEGIWKVEAVATLNGQTKTAADGIDLVVQL